MVAPENPFLSIVPRRNEKIIDMVSIVKELRELVTEALKGDVLIVLKGGYGSGKTLISEHLAKFLKKKNVEVRRLTCTQEIMDDIRAIPDEHKKDIFVVVDGLEVCMGMGEVMTNKLLDLLMERSSKGLTFLLECTPDVLERFCSLNRRFEKFSMVVNIMPIGYDEARELVVSRLNEIRERKSESVEPFTEDELKKYWETSHGNPRMILMLCQSMYDRKVQ
jgi:type II secretory pathway predicted ATPase ExeA